MELYIYNTAGILCETLDVRSAVFATPPYEKNDPLPTQSSPDLLAEKSAQFLQALSPTEAEGFLCFCGGKESPLPILESAATVPCMLLYPRPYFPFKAAIVEQYDPHARNRFGMIHGILGGRVAAMLNGTTVTSPMTMVLLFSDRKEFYTFTAPYVSHLPSLIHSMLDKLQQSHQSAPGIPESECVVPDQKLSLYPIIPTYLQEMEQLTLFPPALDVYEILKNILPILETDPLFAGTKMHLSKPDVLPDAYSFPRPIRFPASAYVTIFTLLSYVVYFISTNNNILISFPYIPWEAHLIAETISLPYTHNGDIYALSDAMPSLAPLFHMVQQLLQIHHIDVRWQSSPDRLFTMCLSIAENDENFMEFKYSDPSRYAVPAAKDACCLLDRLFS